MYLSSPRAQVLSGLLSIACVVACSASSEVKSRGSGGNSNGPQGGSGNSTSQGNGGTATLAFGGSTGGPPPTDPDPMNPGAVHPTCAPGTCTNFPDKPILGEGVPDNAPTLFGDPTNMTSGLCVSEPQLSNGSAPGTMIPANWLRPRFRWSGGSNLDLFEIRIHNDAQKNDLVAYTKKTYWYLPKEIWAGTSTMTAAGDGAANNGAGMPFKVTIRGINQASPGTPVGVSGEFEVAPVVASGSMVFWTVNSAVVSATSSRLLGFKVGDEGVADALTVDKVAWTGQMSEDGSVLRGYYDMPQGAKPGNGKVRCIGCHTSTPDGTAVVFTDDWPWSKAVSSLTSGSVGSIPNFITPGAQALLKMPWWGTQTMSPKLWETGNRILVTSYGYRTSYNETRDKPWFSPNYDAHKDVKLSMHQLAWINLEYSGTINVAVTDTPDYGQPLQMRNEAANAAKGTGWGIIATGDTGSDVSPSLSHDGTKIVYTMTDNAADGHPDYTAKTADIKTIPYSKTGGTSTPLNGASDPNKLEYYPSYSADDKFIAFTRAPAPGGSSPDGPYYNRFGEIMVIPAEGGTATRLVANDPVACVGDDMSRGIINSWPKWSPDAFKTRGKTYYFVIFSSARKYGDEFSQQFKLPLSSASAFTGLNDSSQLWLAAVVVDESGNVKTYPALYVWNQNRLATAGGTGMGIQFSNLTPAWDPFKLPPIVIDNVPPDVVK
ncbi:MAG: hypothetical protein ACOY0T_41105 [Myxococcota bacterium]